ncbi:glycosyltransferase [Erwinia sp. AnSW2-5]|uniref:glycosyltransferase n=1 Tax=Erwinia sp. AnSW2-5 TaxID=3367692 RepID=UPI00385FD5DC
MNIIYVITGMSVGGAEMQLALLAAKMVQRGNRVLIISLSGEVQVAVDDKITIKSLSMSKNPLSMVSALFKASKIISEFKPDIVHSHMFHANVLSRLLRLFKSFPVLISTAHNSNEGGALRMLAYRLTENIPDLSTNVSPDAVAAFVKKKAVSAGNMVAVYNGIDTNKFKYSHFLRESIRSDLSIDVNTDVIFSVGRLVDAKDYPNLIDAYNHLVKNNLLMNKTKLVIVGTGPLEAALKSLVEDYDLSADVLFLGARDDVEQLFNIADVFVLASQWEGFGLVVAEAMACNRLAIGTDSGGVKDVIGPCGMLVPIKNPVALAEAIAHYLQLPLSERDALGYAGRKRIENKFSIELIVDQWIDIYLELIERKVNS